MYDYIQVLSGWISHGCSNTEIVIDWFVKDQPRSNIKNKQTNKQVQQIVRGQSLGPYGAHQVWQNFNLGPMELTKFKHDKQKNKQTSCDTTDTWAHMELTKFG